MKPVTFSVSGFTKRSTCLPPLPTPTNCKLQPDIHPKVPGLSAPFKSVPTGLMRPGPATRATVAAAQAFGCSRARERALWRGVGTRQGGYVGTDPGGDIPLPPSQLKMILASTSSGSAPSNHPTRALQERLHGTPDLGARLPASRPQPEHRGGGGHVKRGVETAVSGLLGRGQRLWSEEKWAGAGEDRPCRRGGGAPSLFNPRDGRARQNGGANGGAGLRESLYRKSLAPCGAGRLEKLKPQSRCPATRGGGCLSPRPHTLAGSGQVAAGLGDVHEGRGEDVVEDGVEVLGRQRRR